MKYNHHIVSLSIGLFIVLSVVCIPSSMMETTESSLMALPVQTSLTSQIQVQSDEQLYQQAFAAQRAKDFVLADTLLRQVKDSVLVGEVLAERYLDSVYTPSYTELMDWLVRYNTLPQAGALYQQALNIKPADAPYPPTPKERVSAKPVSVVSDRSTIRNNSLWKQGIAQFKNRHPLLAADHFRTLLESGTPLVSEDKAAVAFWAYRAFDDLGDGVAAAKYAAIAAVEPPSFYSLLARQVLGEDIIREESAPAKTQAMDESLLSSVVVKRITNLHKIGERKLAEQELETAFYNTDDNGKNTLMALATSLNFETSRIRMAVARAADNGQLDGAYPIPRWTPTTGYKIEPALLFAIIRQESGFNPHAVSTSGARGVMQLMPETANAMASIQGIRNVSIDPSSNMSLGQSYLEALMKTPEVGDNLIYLIAAYNAGPGNLARWVVGKSQEKTDSLVFIESLPYAQTREYVQHVLSNYWIYSALLGSKENAAQAALVQGKWAHYSDSQQLSSMLTSLSNHAKD